MKVVRASEMKEIDGYTIENIGIPGIVLMENAAVRIVQQLEKDVGELLSKNVVVFAGKGNNGGDALAAARHLHNLGVNVLSIVVGPEDSIKGDARINLDILKNMAARLVVVEDQSHFEEIAASLFLADVVVDGLLGTGLRGEVSRLFADIIELVNQSERYILSIDIPSGLDGDTGRSRGICINADRTVTLGFPKLGLLVGDGPKFAGEVEVVDIGIPHKATEERELGINLVTKHKAASLLPARSPFSHKGNHGRVLVIAGSVGLTGAAVLASSAAVRSGAGLVTLGIPSGLYNIVGSKLTEVMTLPLADSGSGFLSSKCIEYLEDLLHNFDVIAAGPGLGCSAEITEVISWLVKHTEAPLVIDADGINSLSLNIDVLTKAKAPVVLTPHPGEMARLTGSEVKDVLENKVDAARDFSTQWNCTVVLKDWRTITAVPDGQIFINTTGNAGMASGGMGDVLTGMIAAFTGQGMNPQAAAAAGVYVHGLAGDISADRKGQLGMTAGDLIESIPYALKELTG